jgi:hypothetical protein
LPAQQATQAKARIGERLAPDFDLAVRPDPKAGSSGLVVVLVITIASVLFLHGIATVQENRGFWVPFWYGVFAIFLYSVGVPFLFFEHRRRERINPTWRLRQQPRQGVP